MASSWSRFLFVIPSEVENGAAREAATSTARPKAERTGSERIKSLDISLRPAVLVGRTALGAYNLEAVRTETTQINNFIDGRFVEPIRSRNRDSIVQAISNP